MESSVMYKTIRLKKIVGDDIYAGLIDCYKKLLAEGNKDKIHYFKALVHGCVKKWSYDAKYTQTHGFVPMKEFLRGNRHNDFYSYVQYSYSLYKNGFLGDKHTIYGYPTKELMKEIF